MRSTSAAGTAGPRFLTMGQVGEILNTSNAQVYALVRSGSMRAIKIGGRGQWRIGTEDLESYLEQAYRDTAAFVASHPLGAADNDIADNDDDENLDELDAGGRRPPPPARPRRRRGAATQALAAETATPRGVRHAPSGHQGPVETH